MKPTIEILDRISENSRNNKEEIFTRLYRYMLRPDLYYLAYKTSMQTKALQQKVLMTTRRMDSAKKKLAKS